MSLSKESAMATRRIKAILSHMNPVPLARGVIATATSTASIPSLSTIAGSEVTPLVLALSDVMYSKHLYAQKDKEGKEGSKRRLFFPLSNKAFRTVMTALYGWARWESAKNPSERLRAFCSLLISLISLIPVYLNGGAGSTEFRIRLMGMLNTWTWIGQQLLSLPSASIDNWLLKVFVKMQRMLHLGPNSAKLFGMHSRIFNSDKKNQKSTGNRMHPFNLIEILISISIIVTFSGLVGVVYPKLLDDSKESNAQLDLHTIASALVIFYSRTSRYPLSLDDLARSGDLAAVPRDPWDNDYKYIPHVDLLALSRALKSRTSGAVTTSTVGANAGADGKAHLGTLEYGIECLRRAASVLSELQSVSSTNAKAGGLDLMGILVACTDGPVICCLGKRGPLFLGAGSSGGSSPGSIGNIPPAKKKEVAGLIQEIRNTAAQAGRREALDAIESVRQVLSS
ncbi:mitochondrial Type II secretion system (T2SS) G-like protein (GspG) [Andalucia godoyi]|uniref:Mitochondrial Type II secretion system (T2SS) G-like protein (GspG) n=1 Tax=Andalucia godoyi TaxID=505711 RepID=A0A8K0AHJ0_ANDGO|nr:mitochondrial Type II secretion system (T2SS) G-like protein (GspG) [Andalucia godoyi]|eukprot:ANDGO_03795.mRNA.1 mitochondrial Type II secretion system (T2SS) G-like protein (GspG)